MPIGFAEIWVNTDEAVGIGWGILDPREGELRRALGYKRLQAPGTQLDLLLPHFGFDLKGEKGKE